MNISNCPACETEINAVPYVVADSNAVTEPLNFYLCGFCGILYAPQAALLSDALYSSRESTNFSPSKNTVLRAIKKFALQRRYSRRLSNWKATRLVDFGCGNGDLANALQEVVTSIVAIDVPSERPKTLNLGIEYHAVSNVNLLAYSTTGTTVFILRHVLEHFEDPVAQLNALSKNAQSGDLFLIETPVKDSLFRRAMGKGWPGYFPPFHVTIPTEESLRIIANRTGLIVMTVKKCNPPIIGTYFTQKTRRWPNIMRTIGLVLYPFQLLFSKLHGSSEALEVLMKKP